MSYIIILSPLLIVGYVDKEFNNLSPNVIPGTFCVIRGVDSLFSNISFSSFSSFVSFVPLLLENANVSSKL